MPNHSGPRIVRKSKRTKRNIIPDTPKIKQPRKKPLKCVLCRYATTVRNKMITHVMNMHTNAKPFACTLCSFKSSRHQGLKRHLRIHTGGELFECHECDFAATHSQALENHIRVHNKEKPYGCDMCSYNGVNLTDLLTHVKVHENEDLLPCYLCENRNSTLSNFKEKTKGCRLCRIHSCLCFQYTTLHLCVLCRKTCMDRWTYSRATIHVPPSFQYNYVNGTLTCAMCDRQFKAKIGYLSHLRSHLRKPGRMKYLIDLTHNRQAPVCYNTCRPA